MKSLVVDASPAVVTLTPSTLTSMLISFCTSAPDVAIAVDATILGVMTQPVPVFVAAGEVSSFSPLNVAVVPVTSTLSPIASARSVFE